LSASVTPGALNKQYTSSDEWACSTRANECRLTIPINALQEAELSQRDRVMLYVTEYFAKSLKVIQNGIFD